MIFTELTPVGKKHFKGKSLFNLGYVECKIPTRLPDEGDLVASTSTAPGLRKEADTEDTLT